MKIKNIVLKIALIFPFIIIIYFSTFVWLYERYTATDTYYSHGFLVPLVTAFLIWQKRKELKKIKRQFNPSQKSLEAYSPRDECHIAFSAQEEASDFSPRSFTSFGLALIILALLIHFASVIAGVFFMSGFSILLLVFGISLYLFGKEITKKISFPLSFLIFMFPLPLVAINAVSFPMRMFVTKSSVFILNIFTNIPVKREGFQILFPKGSLVVENPCSGLRSLIVMLALGSIFAYLLKSSIFKKIILFLLAFPIALVSNLIRVILLCLAVYTYGSQKIMGFFHEFTGYLVFVIAFAGLWFFWRELQ